MAGFWAVNARASYNTAGMVTLQMGATIDPMDPTKLTAKV